MRILLGITGGIAAYKATGLIRGFRAAGHDVTVVPTDNALRFIGKATLEALSGKQIDNELFSSVADVRHVELGQQADLIVVAPATASFLGRLASGIADDLLLNAILASKADVVLCPAMHTEMWQNPATESNVELLSRRGIRIMEPAVGQLTGSDVGPGRLPEVEDILDFIFAAAPLSGKSVVVTAGGTREPIDEVRYIGNHSSGRMGIELARAARDLGANVTLIAANLEHDPPKGMEIIAVSSVDELELAMDRKADAIVMAAAVIDFKVENPYPGKHSRSSAPKLELTPTKDLIANYMALHPKTFGLAFALVDSRQDLAQVSRTKLWDKGVQLVVGNRTAALGSTETDVLLVDGESETRLTGSKSEVAMAIMKRVASEIDALAN